MIKTTICGNLVYDPDLKTVSDDRKVCVITVASNRPGKDTADVLRVEVWGKIAETCKKYLKKAPVSSRPAISKSTCMKRTVRRALLSNSSTHKWSSPIALRQKNNPRFYSRICAPMARSFVLSALFIKIH